MFGLRPLIGLGEERVTHLVVGIVLEGHSGCWVPLGVFLAEAFLGVGAQLEFLALSQFHDENLLGLLPVLVVVFVAVAGGDWKDAGIARLEIGSGDQASLLVVALHLERELDAALGTEIHTETVTAVHHPVDHIVGDQRNQSDSVCCMWTARLKQTNQKLPAISLTNELVGQNSRVGLQLHPVDGDGWCLSDENSSQAVGNTGSFVQK